MKTYNGILIDESIPDGRVLGVIHVFQDYIDFKSEIIHRKIYMNHLQIKGGGANDRLLFFSNPNDTSFSFYTDNRTVLKDDFLRNRESLHTQIKKSLHLGRKLFYTSFIILGLFIGSILGIYFFKDFFIKKIAEKVPTSWEKKAGDQLFSAVTASKKMIVNDSLKKVFLEVAEPLIKQVESKGIKVDLYFSKDSEINAFALPGGKIVFQSGLIENANSWEEVMGVMSHELAHVTERHHVRGLINNIGIYAIVSSLIGDMTAIGGIIANTGGELSSLSNSRNFETEADESGLDFLEKAHINPQGMIDFFRTLEKENKIKTKGAMSFLSTHPVTGDRIKNLQKIIRLRNIKSKPIEHNFAAYKSAFKKQL